MEIQKVRSLSIYYFTSDMASFALSSLALITASNTAGRLRGGFKQTGRNVSLHDCFRL